MCNSTLFMPENTKPTKSSQWCVFGQRQVPYTRPVPIPIPTYLRWANDKELALYFVLRLRGGIHGNYSGVKSSDTVDDVKAKI